MLALAWPRRIFRFGFQTATDLILPRTAGGGAARSAAEGASAAAHRRSLREATRRM